MGNLFPEYVSIQFAGFKLTMALVVFITCGVLVFFLGSDDWIKQVILQSFTVFLLLIIMRLFGDQWAWSWIKEWREKNLEPYLAGFYLVNGKLKYSIAKENSDLIDNAKGYGGLIILPLNGANGQFVYNTVFADCEIKNISIRRDEIPMIVIIDEPHYLFFGRKEFRITLPIDIALKNSSYLHHSISCFLNSINEFALERELILDQAVKECIATLKNSDRSTRTMHEIREKLTAARDDWRKLVEDSMWAPSDRF